MWAHLRVLSHVNNAKRLLLNQLGGKRKAAPRAEQLLDKKAAQLSYCVLQADEYFRAAESVSINTSPLLYFYGMLSLAKATVVANDPQKLLDDVKYHGLHHDKLQRAAIVEDQLALVNGGVFDELMNLVLGYRVPKGSAFRFRDVLAISPELSDMYERYFATSPRWIYFYSQDLTSKDPYGLKVCVVAKDEQRVLSALPERRLEEENMPRSRRGFLGWMVAAAAAVLVAGSFEAARSSVFSHPEIRSEHAQPGAGVPPHMLVVVSTTGNTLHAAGCPFIHDKAHIQTIAAREAQRAG